MDIAAKDNRIVWVDLEMTGLDPSRHVIVEVAALVTDAELNIIDEGVDLVVHATDAELAEMDDFVTQMHSDNGLLDDIKASTVSIEEAEGAVLELVEKHCDPAHPAPLAGNSIATDRTFIKAQMPRLDAALHYRMIDVSTVKELSRRWFPKAYFNQPQKGMAHRALADIVESIRELDYYRRAVFVPAPGPDTEAAVDAAAGATDAYQPFL
ncbi:Oligoribonuclease [Corynebacterium afermentans subsp. afermentans]|uniref:Oligoribonuclease n=1 Tax=Corynebacterium afermentans TaxID=38286 RepID=A0A9X8WJ27_9CORY|nr:oligoribonuclease [Corynebacterium afermentans]OAA16529.1 oligoribonuclease [Corynebacterium afermentans subsp. afermentans]WJY57344.1 Oligoribonuclease [Corynebacterium afermentans subsp. afermentans]SIQ60165.1 oligoribonuclease [Corynebacterium afermentans]